MSPIQPTFRGAHGDVEGDEGYQAYHYSGYTTSDVIGKISYFEVVWPKADSSFS